MSWLQGIGRRYRVSADPIRTLRRIELVALILGALLCLQLAYGAIQLAATTGPDPVQPAADSLQVPAVIGPAVVAANERNEIITRPLFWSGRHPTSAVQTREEPESKVGKLKGVKLVGVFGSGERAGIIALIKDKKRRILVGEGLDGWTLESIGPGEVVLVDGERSETLLLQRGKVTKATTQANAAEADAAKPVRQYTAPAPETAANLDREPAAKRTIATGEKKARPAAKPGQKQGLGLGSK